jgi:hypothetical protein
MPRYDYPIYATEDAVAVSAPSAKAEWIGWGAMDMW